MVRRPPKPLTLALFPEGEGTEVLAGPLAVGSTRAQHLVATQEQSPDVRVREQRLSGVLVAILPHSQDIPTVGML